MRVEKLERAKIALSVPLELSALGWPLEKAANGSVTAILRLRVFSESRELTADS